MITCTKLLRIEAGHRLLKHEGKCRFLHGHGYLFEITVSAAELDEVGRVIDFSAIKEKVGTWLEDNWDHAFIFQNGDPIEDFLREHEQKCYSLSVPPTAENLASFVFFLAKSLLPCEIKVVSVKCHETATCFAEVTG